MISPTATPLTEAPLGGQPSARAAAARATPARSTATPIPSRCSRTSWLDDGARDREAAEVPSRGSPSGAGARRRSRTPRERRWRLTFRECRRRADARPHAQHDRSDHERAARRGPFVIRFSLSSHDRTARPAIRLRDGRAARSTRAGWTPDALHRPRIALRARRRRARAVHDRHAAAERHGDSARRPWAQQHRAGRDHPLARMARRRGALGARHRPRRHRDAERRREAARQRRARRASISAARRSSSARAAFVDGDRRRRSSSSCAPSARRPTGRARRTRCRPSCRARCARRSCGSTSEG